MQRDKLIYLEFAVESFSPCVLLSATPISLRGFEMFPLHVNMFITFLRGTPPS